MLRRCFRLLPDFQASFPNRLYPKTFTPFFRISLFIRNFVPEMDEVMTRKDFEVMAPVGSYESLYAALQGGADSVYFGVEGLNKK